MPPIKIKEGIEKQVNFGVDEEQQVSLMYFCLYLQFKFVPIHALYNLGYFESVLKTSKKQTSSLPQTCCHKQKAGCGTNLKTLTKLLIQDMKLYKYLYQIDGVF